MSFAKWRLFRLVLKELLNFSYRGQEFQSYYISLYQAFGILTFPSILWIFLSSKSYNSCYISYNNIFQMFDNYIFTFVAVFYILEPVWWV